MAAAELPAAELPAANSAPDSARERHNGDWDFGYDTARATRVFDERDYCGDAHISMLANTLTRHIYVSELTEGSGIGRHLRVMRYAPGFLAAKAVTKAEVDQRPENALFLYLQLGHFSAMLSPALQRKTVPRNLSALSAACSVVQAML